MDREMLVQTRKSINIIFNYFGLGGVGKNESKRAPKHAPTRPQRRKSQTITLDNLRSSIRDMTLELQKFLRDDTWKETRKEVGNEKRPSRRMPASMFDIRSKDNLFSYMRDIILDSIMSLMPEAKTEVGKEKQPSQGMSALADDTQSEDVDRNNEQTAALLKMQAA
ncbi:hypothetical protein Q3G72_021212 [Acer saccharum]|nr:hypothetical protein Q3G72_021212 [Acer saccharum]